ncbi:sugar-binding domain-containing protein [Rothia sp. LK2588]|uniref:sugar-binding transcriptional regulator n=1 Tax=Rothia sp. LK2588 TaxID=3114369 RepID=UPI0034CFA628
MNDRNTMAYRAAALYYRHHQTTEAIAKDLGTSRATVSRLLKSARELGIVKIELDDSFRPSGQLDHRIAERFKVRATVVETGPTMSALMRMERVAHEGARLLDSVMTDGTVLGVAWGSTVTEVARFLPTRQLSDVVVVQLNGAGNARHTGIPYSGSILGSVATAYGGQMVHFPVPAFFDQAATKQAMWGERSVQAVLQIQRKAHVALFGIGAFGGAIPSHVYSGGYFDADQQKTLRTQGVVGDICTVLLREDGSYADLEVNQRATGPTPRELAKIPRRIAVVSGGHRLQALRAALQTGAITDLVLDEQLAQALVLQR